jgi:hypothetical protein
MRACRARAIVHPRLRLQNVDRYALARERQRHDHANRSAASNKDGPIRLHHQEST